MKNQKKKIGVYETQEYGAFLFKKNLHKTLLRLQVENEFDIVSVDHKDILNIKRMNELTGLAMPGRNSGQLYRDEWGEQGYSNINVRVNGGMNLITVCASSSVLTDETSWYNRFQPSDNKRVSNKNALFPGMAIGAFDSHWHDGYRSEMKNPDAYHSNVIAAKVMPVSYTPELTKLTEDVEAHGLYWGGCVFIPTDENFPMRVLARHNNTIDIPLMEGRSSRSRPTKTLSFVNPAAVIEFSLGLGLVTISNIHFEIDGPDFEYLFNVTPQAKENSQAFAEDKNRIVQADSFSPLVFDRFITNCAQDSQADKKILAVAMVNG